MNKGLGGNLGNRDAAVKQFNTAGKKWKRDLKSLKRQNKILYSMVKHTGFHRELKKIKSIRDKIAKNNDSYSRNRSSSESE